MICDSDFFGDERLEELVADAISDEPDRVREAFLELEDMLKQRVVDANDSAKLAEEMFALSRSKWSKTRAHVAQLLRYFPRDEAEPHLKRLLQDDSDSVVRAAKRSEAQQAERELIGHLPMALDDRLKSRLDALEKRHNAKARDAAIRLGLFLTEFMVKAMSHQVKNALSPVGSYLQRLAVSLENGDDPKKLQASVLAAQSQLAIAKRVLDQSLKYVTRSPPCYQKTALQALVDSAIDAIRDVPPLPHAEHSFTVCVDPALQIDAAEDLLREALVNILKNAVEATRANGRVEIEVSARRHFGTAVIEISDSGCGMSIEECEHDIWIPYGSRKKGGTGLGMPLVKKIIEVDHRGSVKVESDPLGRLGTTVTLTLPIMQGF